MNTLHERLKEERIRLGFTQEEFAEKGGVKRRAQAHYETGERCPDGHYFSAIAAAGADVQYILTGVRTSQETEPPANYESFSKVKAEKLLEDIPVDMMDDVLKYLEDKKQLADYRAEIETLRNKA